MIADKMVIDSNGGGGEGGGVGQDHERSHFAEPAIICPHRQS